jgi:hypothetical protein
MGVLDQLFADATLDQLPDSGVTARFTPAGWVTAATALAAHQAMSGKPLSFVLREHGDGHLGFPIDTRVTRIPFRTEGKVFTKDAEIQARRYRDIIFESQYPDLTIKDLSDDVVDGGIKSGSRILISIIPEDTSTNKTWNDAVTGYLKDAKNGQPVNLTFDKFSVASISEPDEERYQIIETIGADFIYGFGRRPRIMMLSGSVLNGKMDVRVGGEIRSMDWKNAFMRRYQNSYRLTQCIKERKKILIVAQDTVFTGYLLNMIPFTSAETQAISQVTLSYLITDQRWPQNNDEAIPGWLDPSGFLVTNNTVSSEYFSKANVRAYIQESRIADLDALIELRKRQLFRELLVIEQQKLQYTVSNPITGGRSSIPTAPEVFLEIKANIEEATSDQFFSPVEGFRLNAVYDIGGSSLLNEYWAYGEDRKVLDEKKALERELLGIPPADEAFFVGESSQVSQAPKLDLDIDALLQAQQQLTAEEIAEVQVEIQSLESEVNAEKRGLTSLTSLLNFSASEAISLNLEIKELEESRKKYVDRFGEPESG